MDFTTTIRGWYNKNKRDLPWRNTRDPYKIWLSEVILQQTRVAQGLAYYHKITEALPDVKIMAKASEEKVLKLWQGLGYYSRARNMHTTAKLVAGEYGGKFPQSFNELLALKGIGPYTAAAIASFCFGEAKPVVDGNVYRVLARYYGIKTPIDSTDGKKLFYRLAEELIDKKNPALHNQAIMEFGALQCVPKNPQCENCVLADSCMAKEKNRVDVLPVKEKKTKVKETNFIYFFIRQGNYFFLKKRTGNDIWNGLYDFPLEILKGNPGRKKIMATVAKQDFFKNSGFEIKSTHKALKHQLSHLTIRATFLQITVSASFKPHKDWVKSPVGKAPVYPLPRLIDRFLADVEK